MLVQHLCRMLFNYKISLFVAKNTVIRLHLIDWSKDLSFSANVHTANWILFSQCSQDR